MTGRYEQIYRALTDLLAAEKLDDDDPRLIAARQQAESLLETDEQQNRREYAGYRVKCAKEAYFMSGSLIERLEKAHLVGSTMLSMDADYHGNLCKEAAAALKAQS